MSTTLVEALNTALHDAMADDEVLVMGEDIAELGGVFRVTQGLHAAYGSHRVINTLLAESSIVGTAIGLSIRGFRPVLEIQFDGFVYPAFNQIVSMLAKMHARTRGAVRLPVVIRLPVGGGIGAVEHHSESNEAYFAHTAGLRVVACSNPSDGYWMLRQSIESDDPVIFYEPKREYWHRGAVAGAPDLPLDKARITRPGRDVTLLSYAGMVGPCLAAADELAGEDIQAEVVDLRSIAPLDVATIAQSVRRTGRAVVVQEAPTFVSVGSEIAATVSEECFTFLEAPVARLGGYNLPYPPAKLEGEFLPGIDRIKDAVGRVVNY
ncbi:alpha-ketoacid dehydrogenase subunit beta [Nocardia sp. NPDC050799]|uniref:alpha-ketoacid dehydrogenase subunit beta n=1 Tax=Nocardia sp. NPDC050799 TaxID=3154842 RepID=UPI0033F31CF5